MFICKSTSPQSTPTTRITNNSIILIVYMQINLPRSTSTTRTTNNSITDHFNMFICKSTSPRSTSTTRITNNSITDGVQAICLVGFLRSLVSQDHHSQFVDCQDLTPLIFTMYFQISDYLRQGRVQKDKLKINFSLGNIY